MTTQSGRGAPGGDHFVDELGDRLSTDGGPKEAPPRRPPPLGANGASGDAAHVPPSPAFPPPPTPKDYSEPSNTDVNDQSDIHELPSGEDPDGSDPFAEFEDGLAGESTRIDTEHLLAEEATTILHGAPERPFLEVEKGKDEGKQFFLNVGETGVGRSIDNDVILTDIAVSRKHVKVLVDEDSLPRLRDLGSGNGTLVNGRRVHEVMLHDGDRIEIGETVLVVRVPGDEPTVPRDPTTTDENNPPSIPPPAPTVGMRGPGIGPPPPTPVSTDYIASPRASSGPFGIPKAWLYAFMAIGGVIIALLGATVTTLILRADDSADDPQFDALAELREGLGAYRARRLDDAQQHASRVLSNNPDDAQGQQLMASVQAARTEKAAIDRAREALAQHQHERARQELGSVESSELWSQELESVRADIDAAQVDALRHEAETALEEGDEDLARQRLADMRRIDPQSEAIATLEEALRGPRGHRHGDRDRPDHEPIHESSPTRATGSPSSMGTSRPSTPTHTASMTGPTRSTGSAGYRQLESRVLAAYRSGDFNGAAGQARSGAERLDDADRSRMIRLAGRIEEFGTLYPRANASNATASQLSRAIGLDESISSGGAYANRLKPRLVDMYLNSARAAIGRGNMSEGCANVRNALGVDSDNAAAQRLRGQCEDRARALLEQAQGLERSNPARARAIYDDVMQMVPRGSPILAAGVSAQEHARSLARRRRRRVSLATASPARSYLRVDAAPSTSSSRRARS